MASNNRRNIVVYYFTDSKRTHVISGSTQWYKYPLRAKDKALENLMLNIYGADVAVVYDDSAGKDLYVFVRTKENEIKVAWTAEAEKQKNLASTKDPFGTFTKKKSKSHQIRSTRVVSKK